MSPLSRVQVAFAGWLLAACSGAGSASDASGTAVLVGLRDFKSGARFELASESHTERLTYYSDERVDAVRKVQSDEVMSAFVSELGRLGFGDHAQAGRAPAIAANDVIRWAIEVETEDRTSHWLVGTGSAPEAWKAFTQCRDTFLELYNNTVSYQAVKNQSGKQFFDDKKSTAAGQKLR